MFSRVLAVCKALYSAAFRGCIERRSLIRKKVLTRGEGNDIIGQTTKSLVNQGFREVSPIHFFPGRDLISKRTVLFDIEGGMNLLALNQGQEAFRVA